ncbi:riboflavin synthase [Fluviicola chungangensis]|uniref:Riboflavin synthase n=1 Tax=Fluviicola chungangensis TaxID=2597671 RepID=A0A556MJA4_9FLAO|nr:riboflavin synthase [Fluviicola chungangensis]TSJ39952.1 riboflavin synthase [Fluviicola chungangensis]
MFTGIIETLGTIVAIEKDQSNVHFTVEAAITHELKIDQSVAHNGCCLTVVKIEGDTYVVTAIQETLDKTNLGDWEVGSKVNLERCMLLGARLDGHIVQGHVDTTATCVSIEDLNGSWKYTFRYDFDQPTVAKGSITVNGVSLTVVDSEKGLFSVCIIPYTQEHTNFHRFEVGTKVNLEFDIIGKYVARLMEQQKA